MAQTHININTSRVDCLEWSPGQLTWTARLGDEAPSISSVLENDYFTTSGITILLFPHEARIENLQESEDPLRDSLTNKFVIPSLFWTKTSWDANGFYGAYHDPLKRNDKILNSYSSISRFLIKTVKIKGPAHAMTGNDPMSPESISTNVAYDWEFLGIYSLWAHLKDSPDANSIGVRLKQILVCFDFKYNVRRSVLEAFQNTRPATIDSSPFGAYSMFLQPLVVAYDQALWGFRTPVRTLEKNRVALKGDQINIDEERTRLALRYINMHELQRHIIHSTETLRVATSTLEALRNDIQTRVEALENTMGTEDAQRRINLKNTIETVRFFQVFLGSLQLRAKAFEDRLQNEIRLAFNAVAADSSLNAKEQLLSLKQQNTSLTTTLSIVSLLFLPGSFISGFFGTNFFSIQPVTESPGWRLVAVSQVWWFFVATIPLTVGCLLVYFRLTNRSIKFSVPSLLQIPGKQR